MASINKLSVRGVRSFSPEDSEQVVEFYFPCTIIVGSNGCGKTTIIESLKYAVTGGLPPGNKSGQAFVHDPRSVGQSVVKANVKLRFTSRSGQTMVVVRSMELTQKKTTMSFKQLDGVLRTMDPATGERVSLSHKCTELDKQLPQLLGTTKPILEHVVFCHQEDASWPLMEGAVLKKRFDDIFDSTRYTKALDVFRKTEKEMQSKVKDLKADLAGLKSHQHAAKGFREQYREQQDQLDILDDDKKRLKNDIARAERDMAKYESIMDEQMDKDNDIELKRGELDRHVTILKKQIAMLGKDYKDNVTVRELQNMLSDFDDKMSGQVERRQELEDRTTRLRSEVESLRGQEMKLTSSRGKFAAEREAHEARLRERYETVDHMAKEYGVVPVTQVGGVGASQDPNNQSMVSAVAASQLSVAAAAAAGAGAGLNNSQDDTYISLDADDMERFLQSLDQKETDLKDRLKQHRVRTQANEDKLQAALTDLGGRFKAVENERTKLASQRNEAHKEQTQLSKGMSGSARIRKSEVEDARKNAVRCAKQRDEANNDPRRNEIPIEIRQWEGKIDQIKRQLEDDRIALDNLRHSAEAQNAIVVLQEQCTTDQESLEESLQEHNYTLNKFHLHVPPKRLPRDGDDNGDLLVNAVEAVVESVRAKHDELRTDVDRAADDVSRTQHSVSEKTALLNSVQQQLALVRSNMDTLTGDRGGIAKIKRTVQAMLEHDAGLEPVETTIDENSPPRDLSNYLDQRLQQLEDDVASDIEGPKVARRILKRIKKMALKPLDGQLACPCCRRGMDPNEVHAFISSMDQLMNESELVTINEAAAEEYRASKANYAKWKRVVSEGTDDLRDYRRLTQEATDLEDKARQYQEALQASQAALTVERQKAEECQEQHAELVALQDAAKRWTEDAGRIADKRMQINQKYLDLSVSTADDPAGRDLKTVEREMNDRMEEKDQMMNKINRLNKELSSLNNRISLAANTASRTEQLAREKEAKYEAEQKATKRKTELLEQLQSIGEEEKKLQEQMAPLRQKIRTKESEKQRMRSMANEEESSLQENLNKFLSDAKHLRDLNDKIDRYLMSDKPAELERITEQVKRLVEQMETKKGELKELQPELERIAAAVNDQERHKKQLHENIEVLKAKKVTAQLKEEIASLEEERRSMGNETAQAEFDAAKKVKENTSAKYARIEGRWGEIVEQIRAIKRKLKAPEYKNVDEDCQVFSIKHDTTKMAAEDLKKYYNALDKALLQYHRVKITEINKIIRELWLLTYKGEDISNIELVSGQEPGSRATKSYNYRVVMTKGTTRLDMRGRCSAGQRVLASIVIRLALAETFGVNCGCIALDEPTVNLDYRNKKGLALALAQIVASRSQQRNFQLILITHDEEFVAMMKTELSSLSGFSMPEKYFQVHREQGPDGKFYSKINAVDWDELV